MRSIYRQFGITDEVLDYAAPVLEKLTERFRQIDEVAEYNQLRVIKAMQDAHIGEANLKGTTGYGYDDIGRDGLERVYASAEGDSLNEMLAQCDYVVLCVELNDSTYHMIGEEQFKAMKDSAYLINMGRGALVDEPVMIEALKNGVIAGAGLDTFEQEPLPADSPLWDLPNVLITPHVTPQLPDREERMLSYVYQNLKAYREGGEFVNRVTPRNIFSK